MPHQFTEPTPSGQAGFHTVEVFVASWEIECCALPPAVGGPSTWTLKYFSAVEFPSPGLDRESTWRATRWPAQTLRPVATELSDGPITACWTPIDTDRPTGIVHLRGRLCGTVHGGLVPDGFPRTTGRVDRIRLATQQYIKVADGAWEPVPSTIMLTDIQHSPRWFTDDPAAPPTDGSAWIVQTGVLLDLAVPETR